MLAILTMTGKLVATQPPLGEDRPLFAKSVSAMLTQQGFGTRFRAHPAGIIVYARKNECRLRVLEYPPDGSRLATVTTQAQGVGRLSFAYRGKLHTRAPKVRPLADYYLRRIFLRFGLASPRTPIVSVAASPGCPVAALPWERLSVLAR